MDRELRANLVRSACKRHRNGESVTEIARTIGVPRTTVYGWCHGHDKPRGRERKLHVFNEAQILVELSNNDAPVDWEVVKLEVQRKSGTQIGRRSVFHLLTKWGITSKRSLSTGGVLLEATKWEPDPEIEMYANHNLRGMMLWRMISGRGVESFVFTSGNSPEDLIKVVNAFLPKLIRVRNGRWTNHRGLMKALPKKMKIELVQPEHQL